MSVFVSAGCMSSDREASVVAAACTPITRNISAQSVNQSQRLRVATQADDVVGDDAAEPHVVLLQPQSSTGLYH